MQMPKEPERSTLMLPAIASFPWTAAKTWKSMKRKL